MSDLQVIQTVIERAARRRRWERAWKGLWKGFLAGSLAWLVALVLYKVLPLPVAVLPLAALAALAVTMAGFASGWFRRMTTQETARWLDQRKQLKERLSTALEISRSGKADQWRDLLVADAAGHARDLDPRKLLPITLPAASRWALIVLLVTAGLGFVPEYRTKEFVQKQQDAAHIAETGRKLAELTKRNLAQHPQAQPAVEKAMQTVQETADRLQTASLSKPEAIRDLTSVADKLKEQAKDLGQNPALKRMERAAREGSEPMAASSDLQKRIEDLQKALGDRGDTKALDKLKRDLEKLQQAASSMSTDGANSEAREQMAQSLASLAKQAEALGVNLPQLNEAIEALMGAKIDQVLQDLDAALSDLNKMKELAQQLQQLKGRMEKMGKDLAEQLDKGQAGAAKSTLEKMIQQLQQANPSPEQMQKMIDEVAKAISPAGDYGKVAEHLKEAVLRMRQGQRQQGSEALAKAAKELEELMAQSQDMDALLAALEHLKNAQIAIGSGQ